MRFLAPLLLAPSIVLFSCSKAEQPAACHTNTAVVVSEPNVIAERFLNAFGQDNKLGLASVLTPTALQQMTEDDSFSMGASTLQSFEIGETTIEGTQAKVAFVGFSDGEEQAAEILLRDCSLENLGWRVYGMSVWLGDAQMQINFEQIGEVLGDFTEELGNAMQEQMQAAFDEAQATWERGGTDEEIAAERASFEAVQAVSESEHDATWQVDVSGAGRSAKIVLKELIKGTGLQVDLKGSDEAFDRELDLNLANVSRVEAVEHVAAQLGFHPVWPSTQPESNWGMNEAQSSEPPALTFVSGSRSLPATFTGPFIVEVSELTENTPYPTGEVKLTVRALGLDSSVLKFQNSSNEILSIETLRGLDDQPLTDESMHHFGSPEMRAGYFTYSLSKDLTGLLRGVEQITNLNGVVQLRIPESVEECSWEAGKTEPRELELGTLSLVEWDASSQFRLTGDNLEGVKALSSPLVTDGGPLGVLYQSSDQWGDKVNAQLQCPEPPASVEFKFCRAKTLSYAFELPPIAFQEFAQRPAQPMPLEFAGSAPCDFKLVGDLREENGMHQVTLQLTNETNKDIAQLTVNFEYLDRSAKALEDFPHTLSGNYDFDLNGNAPLATSQATVELDTHAAFVPEGTASIRFQLQSVEFLDGTNWSTEAR